MSVSAASVRGHGVLSTHVCTNDSCVGPTAGGSGRATQVSFHCSRNNRLLFWRGLACFIRQHRMQVHCSVWCK